VRLLVTGARGFIGRTVADVAQKRGWDVVGVGRSSQAPTDWVGAYQWADVAQSDLLPVIDGFTPDVVFHGAGAASVGGSFDAPYDDLRASVMTFASVLDAVRRSKSRPKVLFPSSAAVYGNPAKLPVCETDPTNPISPYGYHKLQCELLAKEFVSCFDIEVTVCRIFSVVGDRQRRLLVWELYEQLIGNAPDIRLQGTGHETRDYLHSEDAAAAMLELAMLDSSGEASAHSVPTFNIASGNEVSVRDLIESLSTLLKIRKPVISADEQRIGDPSRWCADITGLKQAVETWSPKPLGEMLSDTVTVWRS
jgi:UDP-glucose 4-epimerase